MCLVAQSCLTLCDPMNCSLPGSSVHGILQARILEWIAISFSGSSHPRDRTRVSCVSYMGRQILTTEPPNTMQCISFPFLHSIPSFFLPYISLLLFPLLSLLPLPPFPLSLPHLFCLGCLEAQNQIFHLNVIALSITRLFHWIHIYFHGYQSPGTSVTKMSQMWCLPFRNANRRNRHVSTHAIIKPSVGVQLECSRKAD